MRRSRRKARREDGAGGLAGAAGEAHSSPDVVPARRWAAASAIALAVFAAFGGALANGFVNWDDNVYIYANPHITSLGVENLKWMLANRFPQWGPLASLAHAFDYALFGLAPAGHHLTSLLLHAANACLVMALFLAIADASGRAQNGVARLAGGFFAGLLFAVHPLRVESVAWAAEKKDLLCALFFLLTMLAWLRRAAAKTARARYLAFAATHVFLALALLSKPMAVTAPACLLLLDFYPLKRLSLRSFPVLLGEKLLLFALVLPSVYFGMHPAMREPGSGGLSKGLLQPKDRVLIPLRASVFYLEKTLWPANLVPFYPLPPPERRDFDEPEFALATAVVVLLSALALWRWLRGERIWIAAWAYYLGSLLPASGVVPLSGQMASDRYSYLPTVSAYLLVGAGIAWAWSAGALARRLALAAALAANLALMLCTRAQVRIWKDSWVFWGFVIDRFPEVVMAHNNLGALYEERGLRSNSPADLERAEAEFRRVIALFPMHANAYNNLGLIYEQRGDFATAKSFYLSAIHLVPGHRQANLNLSRLRGKMGAP